MLIVFVKRPVLGQVKTRLAASIGAEEALATYEQLLEQTAQELRDFLLCPTSIYYANGLPSDEEPCAFRGFERRKQAAFPDLGLRMHSAFEDAFARGAKKVLLIGSDCPDMTSGLLELAWQLLDSRDVLLGPARDGGYYLIGLKAAAPELFLNKTWSHEQVYAQALESIEALGLSYLALPELYDIDRKEDLDFWQKQSHK